MHIRLHSGCGTDLGRSIAVVTYNVHAICVVKPVYGYRTFPLTVKAVLSKGHININLTFSLQPPGGVRGSATQQKKVNIKTDIH